MQVGFDGEGVNLGPKGQLTLVQISTVGGQVGVIIVHWCWCHVYLYVDHHIYSCDDQNDQNHGQVIIFDVQTCPALISQGGLKQLLESEHIIKVIIVIIIWSSSSKDQFLASVNLWHSFVRILGQQVKCEIVESTLCIHFSTFLYCLCSRVRTSGCCPTMNDFPQLRHCQPFHYLFGHHHCLFHHLDHPPQSWSSLGCARLSERLSCSLLPVRRPS